MFLDEFFLLHKSDRKVVLIVLVLAALALVGIEIVGDGPSSDEPSAAADSLSIAADTAVRQRAPLYYRVEAHQPERFAFDPNTADSTQLLRLGLQPWQVRNIYKYRAAGGIYRRREDFARLYGLTRKQYAELEPYITISPDYLPASTLVGDRQPSHRDTLQYPVKLHEGETIDLATADTSALRRVPGIGSYYARRIAEYRQRLGGYVSTQQLTEIDGFPPDALSYFTLSAAAPVQRINVNKLSLEQLRRHPYINYYQARAITDYRRLHGRISSLDDLHMLRDFPAEAIDRLRPYVEY